MNKTSHLFAAALALAALAGTATSASAQEASPSASPAGSRNAAPPKHKAEGGGSQASSTGAAGGGDRDFAMTAAKGGMMEAHMGEMAERQGQSAEVKKLGATIVSDHTKANNELMRIAQAKGMKLDTRYKMDKMESANFDQAWLTQMASDHQKDIALFEKESKTGTDPQLKMFATKTLPTLKKHMAMVMAAQKKMGGSSMKKS